MIRRAYIGLGSNVGDRMAMLRAALAELPRLGSLCGVSRVYETEPVGYAEQDNFLNAVVRLDTPLEPEALLAELKTAEARLGRLPRFLNGPREIDLDLLLLGDVVRAADPVLPHPRMGERRFVLEPLRDLAPELRIPGRGSVRELLAALPPGGIREWPDSLDAS